MMSANLSKLISGNLYFAVKPCSNECLLFYFIAKRASPKIEYFYSIKEINNGNFDFKEISEKDILPFYLFNLTFLCENSDLNLSEFERLYFNNEIEPIIKLIQQITNTKFFKHES